MITNVILEYISLSVQIINVKNTFHVAVCSFSAMKTADILLCRIKTNTERNGGFMITDKRFAVLIDSDNVSSKYIKAILDELSNDGIITYKRIYGDWTNPLQGAWKNVLLNHSITPIQQYSYTQGKNSTDSAMIIDAMDILYSGNVDGFCIVSSDSDFTRLAVRLREAGKFVIGMGEKKTPNPFIQACNSFKYLEAISSNEIPAKLPENGPAELTKDIVKGAVDMIIEEISDEDGWASLSETGNILTKRFPNFDYRHFGYPKLAKFIESLNAYVIHYEKGNDRNTNVSVVYIKKKQH